MKDKFLQFLQDNDALDDFRDEFADKRKDWGDLGLYLTGTTPKHYISMAFKWNDSKQGKPYWSVLNKKWEDVCDES